MSMKSHMSAQAQRNASFSFFLDFSKAEKGAEQEAQTFFFRLLHSDVTAAAKNTRDRFSSLTDSKLEFLDKSALGNLGCSDVVFILRWSINMS